MKYAGIGARKTPASVQIQMQSIARSFDARGFLLRSGGAGGGDTAFQTGLLNGDHCEIWRPEHSTPDAYDLAAKYHPAWEKCSAIAQALHARNGLIMLGRNLNDPVDFVVCWTPGGAITGGTGQALRIAEAYQIPVFNFATDPFMTKLFVWLADK